MRSYNNIDCTTCYRTIIKYYCINMDNNILEKYCENCYFYFSEYTNKPIIIISKEKYNKYLIMNE